MNDLQAIIDFQVELHKFVNIDLFQRGLYQIRVNHHISSKIPHKIEVSFLEDCSKKKRDNESSLSSVVFPASIINGVAVSKTFNILYKNEEKMLDDVIHFKDHIIVDSANCFQQLSDTEFYLDIELWFTESNYVPTNQELIRLMFKRQLRLHFDVCRGLHYFLPVQFDYFHLSTVTISVHACLVTLCLPYLSKQGLNGKTNKVGELETTTSYGLGYDQLFFGCKVNEIQNQIKANCKDILAGKTDEILSLRQRRAQLLCWQLCSILLTSIQNLSRKFSDYVKLLPPLVQCKYRKDRFINRFQIANLSELAQKCYNSCLEYGLKSTSQDFVHFHSLNFAKEILNKKIDKESTNNKSTNAQQNQPDGVDCVDAEIKKDEKIVDKNDNILLNQNLPSIYQPEDYIASIVSDLAYICGSLIVSWQNFIKLVTHNEKINQHLSKVHHLHRCKRFSELFFVKLKPLDQLISADQDAQLFYELNEKLRKSTYLQKLPVCQIECASLDGEQSTMPIIFEEKFDLDEESANRTKKSSSAPKSNDKNSNDKELKEDDTKKSLRRSSSDLSTNSSLTDSSLNSVTNSSTDNTNNSSSNSADDAKKVKRTTSSKLKDRFVHSLNKLNLNTSITRRKSSISYLSKQEQQKIVLNENLSSSSTNNSNNSSLNNQSATKLNLDSSIDKTIDSPLIVIDDSNSINNDSSLRSSTIQECSNNKLIGYKGYKGIKGEIEEFLLDSNGHAIVETISLNNIKQINGQNSSKSTNKKRSSKNQKKKLTNSESLPDLSVKNLQKTIKRMTKKNSKKLKVKKEKKESKKSIKSTDLANKTKSDLLIDTISLNFSTNIIDSLNKTNLDLDEKDEFSDLDGFIDEEDDKTDSSSLIHFKKDFNTSDLNKCTILEMFTRNTCLLCGIENCNCIDLDLSLGTKNHRLSMITNELIAFVKAKEQFRNEMSLKANGFHIYSDFANQASRIPYFQCDSDLIKTFNTDGVHLVVCVHGLDGNCADLRLVKTYLELSLPFSNFDFLMSESNQGKTYDSFEVLTERLKNEIIEHIKSSCLQPTKVSFIGHSLGNIIIRSVLRKPELDFLLPRLHCFLSLSGPHLGTVYMTNKLVNLGLLIMRKWKKSTSLLQLCMKDDVDPYKTFIYNLSKDSKIHLFKYVLLCGSSQDHYVPKHSAHIQICNQSIQDLSSTARCHRDMIDNIMKPFLSSKKQEVKPNEVKKCVELMRFDVWHPDAGGTNSLIDKSIGRHAHILVLDCELFIEKFMTIVGLKYFE